jgi:hypothetical protein
METLTEQICRGQRSIHPMSGIIGCLEKSECEEEEISNVTTFWMHVNGLYG